jgi:hypothetical protein
MRVIKIDAYRVFVMIDGDKKGGQYIQNHELDYFRENQTLLKSKSEPKPKRGINEMLKDPNFIKLLNKRNAELKVEEWRSEFGNCPPKELFESFCPIINNNLPEPDLITPASARINEIFGKLFKTLNC